MKVPSARKLCPLVAACVSCFGVATSLVSQSAITQQDSYPGLTITGTVGATYPIQYVNAVSNVNSTWITLTNLVLPSSPYLFLDTSAPNVQKRFYRETNVTFTARKYVGLTITGTVGSTNRIQYTEATGNTNVWRPLATNVLAASPSQFFDILSPAGAMRLYRVQDLARVPQITSASSTFALVGQPFSYQITVDSDLAITNYDASLLPAGLNINNSTGLISGTPTQEGTNNVTLTARNSSGPGTQSLSLRVRSTLATELVSIPAGSFTMGSPTTEVGHTVFEEPQTQVTFSHAFSIGKYEVSQAEYQAVVGANPSLFPGDLNRPIDNISWQDATNFCALLTARDRLSGRISATSVYRLPTEAEWEYVARAGTSTAYTFGDDAANLGQYAWFTDNSGTMPHPTGQKLANPWGVYDMYGNTWEFCSDWFGNYPGGSVTDPQGAATGTRKIVRGGSWFRSPESLRSGKRAVLPPEGHNGDVGFRIVLFTP